MQTAELQINSKPYPNVDPIVLDGTYSQSLYDAYIDEFGNTVSRPGNVFFTRLNTNFPSQGGYWWERKNLVVSNSDGHLLAMNEAGNIFELTNSDLLLSTGRSTFVDNGDYLIIANGGRMLYTNGTPGSAAYIADPDAPTNVSHVAFLDNYVLANEIGTGRFYYAVFTGAPTTWNPIDVYSAEFNPDNIISLFVQNNMVVLVGTQSVELWINDGVSPFSRLGNGALSRGGMSPYSNCLIFENFFFFDNRRRFCLLSGLSAQVLSTPYDRLFQSLTTVSDCFAYYNTILGRNFIYIIFPTADRSFCYDIQSDYWVETSFWNSNLSMRQRFIGSWYVYASGWNKHIIGSWQNDSVYELSESFESDNGNTILTDRITGYFDHGNPKVRKRSYRLDVRIKCGEGVGESGTETPYIRFRYKDINREGSAMWSNWRLIPIGSVGKTDFIVTIRNLGSYYARQYQFQNANPVKFVLGKCVETFDIYAH